MPPGVAPASRTSTRGRVAPDDRRRTVHSVPHRSPGLACRCGSAVDRNASRVPERGHRGTVPPNESTQRCRDLFGCIRFRKGDSTPVHGLRRMDCRRRAVAMRLRVGPRWRAPARPECSPRPAARIAGWQQIDVDGPMLAHRAAKGMPPLAEVRERRDVMGISHQPGNRTVVPGIRRTTRPWHSTSIPAASRGSTLMMTPFPLTRRCRCSPR